MDVIKSKKSRRKLLGMNPVVVIGFCAVAVAAYTLTNEKSVSVERQELIIGEVKRGDLPVTIEGYGRLTSHKQQLITALSQATVKEIVLRPGAAVESHSVIARMENPELSQQVEKASQQLALSKANLRQLKVNQQREVLNEKSQLAQIEANYENAKLKREAEQKLIEHGIVSDLDFKRSQLNETLLAKRIELFKQRLQQLSQVHIEAVNIQQERIKQYEGELAVVQNRFDKLTVRAGFDGVLQRLSVELGQSLNPGQEIALIGSTSDLIAQIQVPQSQAQLIRLGQEAIVDTRKHEITGYVSRIDPMVVNNTVTLDVAFDGPLPDSARLELSVDGLVIADTLENVLYIERPASFRRDGNTPIYKLSADTQNALLSQVKFGQATGRFIEVASGAQSGERFILSDMSNLVDTHTALEIQ